MVVVTHHDVVLSGQKTGALDIGLAGRRVLSVPTQLGCRVGCTFCVSSATPLARNLRAREMVEMVEQALLVHEADGRPIELSFTGEGEGILNLREARAATLELVKRHSTIRAARYSFSGLGAPKLLGEIPTDLPTRLQFSLHAARQTVRDRLVPRSAPLVDILAAMSQHQQRFAGVELNVVLQDGVNDSDEDLLALTRWGDLAWPILLSPLLSDPREIRAERTALFENGLRAAGREVKRYSDVGAAISRQGLYPRLTARPAPTPMFRIPVVADTSGHEVTARRPGPR